MIKPTILIVDDQESQRLLTHESLMQGGFNVIESTSGEEALARFDEGLPDAIVLDVMMPGMDGFEVCRRLRGSVIGKHVPIMLMTARDDDEAIKEAFEAGATDFIPKPINPIILRHRMRYMLRSTENADALRSNKVMLDHAEGMALTGGWEWHQCSGKLSWTKGFCQLFGLSEASDAQLDELMRIFPRSQQKRLRDLFDHPSEVPVPIRFEHSVCNGVVEPRYFESRIDVRVHDYTGQPLVSGTIQEITNRRRQEKEIRQLAYYDELTGLPNRSHALQKLQTLIETDQRPFGVFHIDLDGFKKINELGTRQVGDEILRETASILVDAVSTGIFASQSSVIRLGGDEFLVLRPLNDSETFDQFGRTLKDCLERTSEIRGRSHHLSASIGISLYPDDGVDVETLLRNADSALCEAKRQGKALTKRYVREIHDAALARATMEHDLRSGLAGGELQVFYQPKVNAMLEQVVGMEALVRWFPAEGRMISPAEFIPLAEESSLIEELGRFVLRESCRQTVAWLNDGLPELQVAVNLSAKQLENPGLVAEIEGIILETGVPPHLLCLEITEGMMMENPDVTIEILRGLKALGCKIAVDDFGTGYSSLSYLQKFPIDSLKIDQSFVRNLNSDLGSHTIVAAVVRLAQTLGLKVVAEGVESTEHERILKSMACDEIQGYLYSKPLCAPEFEAWLKNRLSVSTVLRAAV